jgi:ApaG protein
MPPRLKYMNQLLINVKKIVSFSINFDLAKRLDTMSTAITEGVQITVSTSFREDLSNQEESQFFFNYYIEMQNHNDFNVQLIHRDWYIFDSLNEPRFVSGEGVVGQQPIMRSDEKFSYTSGCELFSEIGLMKGFYTFKNLENGNLFQVQIPVFSLIFPPRLN